MGEARSVYRLLAAFDFSQTASLALDQAVIQLAPYLPAELHVVAVLDPHVEELLRAGEDEKATVVELADRLRLRVEEEVGRRLAGAGIASHPLIASHVHVRLGKPADEIAAVAEEVDANLVIVGTHGWTGIRRLVLGSVAELTVRRAHCPVLVVRPHETRRPLGPAVEDPCPDCLATRRETNGAQEWCAGHREMRRAAPLSSHGNPFEPTLPSARDLV